MKNLKSNQYTVKLGVITRICVGITLTFALSSCFMAGKKKIEKGIFVGENLLQKDTIFTDTIIGDITSIIVLPKDSNTNNELLFIGQNGAVYLDKNGKELERVLFEEHAMCALPIEEDKASGHSFINVGGGWQPVFLMDSEGKISWKYNDENFGTANNLTLVDINKDGMDEMIIGTNGSSGIYAFNHKNEIVWHEEASNVFSVSLFEENGEELIIHSDIGGPVIRKLNGDFVRKLEVPIYSFYVENLEELNGQQVLCTYGDSNMQAYNFYGEKVFEKIFEHVRFAGSYSESNLVGSNGKLVGVSHKASTHTSEIYLLDKNDTVLYHEVYSGKGPVTAEYNSSENAKPWLLVGGDNGEVYRYRKAM